MMYKLLIVAACVTTVCLADKSARNLVYENEVDPLGAYHWRYETSNDIRAQEGGHGSVIAQGAVQWFAPDGTALHLSYTADQNGFHPVGDHLPTPPPTPPYILRALEWVRTHPTTEATPTKNSI